MYYVVLILKLNNYLRRFFTNIIIIPDAGAPHAVFIVDKSFTALVLLVSAIYELFCSLYVNIFQFIRMHLADVYVCVNMQEVIPTGMPVQYI